MTMSSWPDVVLRQDSSAAAELCENKEEGAAYWGKYHPMCHHMMFRQGTGWYYNQRRHKTVILSYRLRCSHFQFSNFITFPSIEKFLSHLRFSPLKFHVTTLTLITSLIQRDGLKIMILSVRLSRERCHLHIVREVTGNKIVAKLSQISP